MSSVASKVEYFLYGTPHLVGSGAVLLGLALYFGGFIGPGWWAILIGLYVAGFLLARGLTNTAAVAAELDESRLLQELRTLAESARKRVPQDARVLIDTIVEKANTLIPALDSLEKRGVIGAKVRHDVLTGITRYLPDTLGSYLALPPAYLKLHQAGTNSPTRMLTEQLALIDRHMDTCLKDAFDEHASALAVNGRFLADKMGGGLGV